MDEIKMKKFNFIKTIAAGVLATTMSLSATASFMTVEGVGGFSAATLGDNSAANMYDEIGATGLYQGVNWGIESGHGLSSLYLVDYFADITSLDTNYLVSTLTHSNNSVNGDTDDFLKEATITGLLDIQSTAVGGAHDGFGNVFLPFDFLLPVIFGIDFEETRNVFNVANCTAHDGDDDEDGVAGGGDHNYSSTCDDRFDYTVDGTGQLPFSVPMMLDGSEYYLTISATTDAAGNNPLSQNRFWTEEGKDTTIYSWVSLSKVPEPASIAILGLGLIGLASRKRKS
jgi:hypothetical protein